MRRAFANDSLVAGVEQEDKGDDSVSCGVALLLDVEGGANGLQDEEHQHANTGRDEQNTTSNLVDHGRGKQGPAQVPDLQDTVDQELSDEKFRGVHGIVSQVSHEPE